MATPKILKLFYFSSDFDGVFSKGFLMKNVLKVSPRHFLILFTVFEIKGAKGAKNRNFKVT